MSLFNFGRGPFASRAPIVPLSYPPRSLDYAPEAHIIPTLLLSYLPPRDGHIDQAVTGDVGAPLETIRQHTRETTRRIIHALEEGSIYHGYKDPSARPSLRYKIVGQVEILEPLPTHSKPGHETPMTDYNSIARRVDLARWVREEGVKEVWLWGYHGGVIDLWESNMAGPHGDISNSDRDPDDLPCFASTYTFFHYNYGRGASEAVEDHLHQIEAVLRHADEGLFWGRFVGRVGEGRCGWSHFPPNGRRDYDWANPGLISTDIEDWRPQGGARQVLNCERWQGDSLTWFIYWMQNLPGAGSALSNWWDWIGDFDGSVARGTGLLG